MFGTRMKRARFWKHLVRKMRSRGISKTDSTEEYPDYEYFYADDYKNRKRHRKLPVFDPDYNVFHLMVVLTLLFMALYVFGTSLPSWYVLQEPVTNFTRCASADYYVTTREREARVPRKSMIHIAASLWFVKIQVYDSNGTFSRYMPYISVTPIPSSKGLYGFILEQLLSAPIRDFIVN